MCVYVQGDMLNVVSAEDLVKVLWSHSKMKGLRNETAKAYVQRETGAIASIARAVQAATAPTMLQQILQRGSRGAVASGGSHEALSVSVNADGHAVAERRVERVVVLLEGGCVQIQQCAQQVLLPGPDLGKRRARPGAEGVDAHLLELQCDKMQINNDKRRNENDQRRIDNKLATVHWFASTMELLDPTWRRDKRLVLQAQDYLQNSLFRASAAPQLEDGRAQSASISVSQVAFELGDALSAEQCIAAGKRAAKMYRAQHGGPPPKHDQTVRGLEVSVNSYTERDRSLLETAIRDTPQ